jgi:mannose-6-phosphate isomerase-like protein (cupin superfamily)
VSHKSIKKVNLKEKFDTFSEHWSPRIAGELNGQHVKLVKAQGEFVMHQHDNEDEMFMVIEGQLLMELEGETLEINAGEFVIIPKGTQHKPIAPVETKLMLFEPNTTINTGNTENAFTVMKPGRI